MHLVRDLAIASLTGIAFGLGAPPLGWVPLYWLAFAPLLLMARRQTRKRDALAVGLAGGLGVGLVGFPWIGEMLVRFVGVPWLIGFAGTFLFAFWLAIPYALFALAIYLGPRRGAASLLFPVLLFPALHAAWPVLFPYTPVLGFALRPMWMQAAEIGGESLVEMLVIASGVCVAEAIRNEDRDIQIRWAAAAVAIPILSGVAGLMRMSAIEAEASQGRSWRVAIIQPNLPVGGRISRGQRVARLRDPSARAEADGAEMVLWPEAGTFPYRMTRPLSDESEVGTMGIRGRLRGPVVTGAATFGVDDEFGFNSMILVDHEGRIPAIYDKHELMPLGESIPVLDPKWVKSLIPQLSHLNAGKGPARFEIARPGDGTVSLASVAAGPLICYEDIKAGYSRAVAAQVGGIEVFLNSTIDDWYGDTAEPWEHLALAQFRSVEHRIPMLRSVSTGVSAAIDQNGRLLASIPKRPVTQLNLREWPAEARVVDLQLARRTDRDPTLYARGGYLLPHAAGLTAVIMLVAARRGRR